MRGECCVFILSLTQLLAYEEVMRRGRKWQEGGGKS